jgi:DNA modification methylase
VKIGELVEDPNNVRVHPKKNMDAIKASLNEFSQVEPLVVRKDTGTVVGGNGRLRAMKSLGWTEAKIVRVDVDDKSAARLGVALNRTSELAEWDESGLAQMLESFALDGDGLDDLEVLGFDTKDLESIAFEETKSLSELITQDEVPEPPKVAVSKLGDVWKLGRHTVVCGDCMDVEYPKDFDLLVTDPPYGVSYASKNEFLNAVDEGNRNQTPIENDHMTVSDMAEFWKAAFSRLNDNAKPGACYYMTGPQGGDLSMMMMMMQESGWLLKHVLIWAKNNHVLGRCDYNYKHEPILYGWKPGAAHYYGGGSDTSVWEIAKPHSSKEHPTMKPVELFAKCVSNGSRVGETVVDPFLGSGTTLIAAEQLDRTCYGIELEPKYVDVIIERFENLTGQKAKRA